MAKAKKAAKKVLTKTSKKAVKKKLTTVSKKVEKAPDVSGKEQVDAFLRSFEHPFKAEIEELRKIILKASPKMEERIKWNSPSFYYKEDFAAIHVRQQEFVHLVLVFPKGLIKDDSGLLEGDYKDRRMAYFYSMEDVKSKAPVLTKIVKQWVQLI